MTLWRETTHVQLCCICIQCLMGLVSSTLQSILYPLAGCSSRVALAGRKRCIAPQGERNGPRVCFWLQLASQIDARTGGGNKGRSSVGRVARPTFASWRAVRTSPANLAPPPRGRLFLINSLSSRSLCTDDRRTHLFQQSSWRPTDLQAPPCIRPGATAFGTAGEGR